MPTGYTCIVDEGCTLREYALRCARAFGVLYHMRDHSLDEALPDVIEPDSYDKDALEAEKQEYVKLQGMTVGECGEAARQFNEKNTKAYEECRERIRVTKNRYKDMREWVSAWNPPTKEHEGLKSFMLEQLDTGYPRGYTPPQAEELTGAQWKEREEKRLEESIRYHREMYAKAVKRAKEVTEWVKALKASL